MTRPGGENTSTGHGSQKVIDHVIDIDLLPPQPAHDDGVAVRCDVAVLFDTGLQRVPRAVTKEHSRRGQTGRAAVAIGEWMHEQQPEMKSRRHQRGRLSRQAGSVCQLLHQTQNPPRSEANPMAIDPDRSSPPPTRPSHHPAHAQKVGGRYLLRPSQSDLDRRGECGFKPGGCLATGSGVSVATRSPPRRGCSESCIEREARPVQDPEQGGPAKAPGADCGKPFSRGRSQIHVAVGVRHSSLLCGLGHVLQSW